MSKYKTFTQTECKHPQTPSQINVFLYLNLEIWDMKIKDSTFNRQQATLICYKMGEGAAEEALPQPTHSTSQ